VAVGEFGRGEAGVVAGHQRPPVVVQVEDGVDRDEVHVRLEVGVDRADVPPVVLVALRGPGHVVVGEVVHAARALFGELGDDRPTHVVLGRFVGCVLDEDVVEGVGVEHVVAHRGEDLRGVVRQAFGVLGLLQEVLDDTTLTVSQVFATTPDFVVGDPDDEEETEAVPLIQHDMVDLLQSVIDEAGITLPFNPVCPDGCADDAEVPGLDHLDDDSDDSDSGAARSIDPRWSGLEKFL